MTVDLSGLPSLTNDTFIPLYRDKRRFLVLKGGAGSGKSVFVVEKLLYRILTEQYPAHPHRILVLRKVAKTLRESCFALICGVIRQWGLDRLFRINKTDMSITCVNGNQFILAGLDDVEKLKSIFDITGVWGEEANEFEARDLRQVNLRLRGWTPFYKQIIVSFNPVAYSNWLRGEFFAFERSDTTIHNSTYLDNKFIDADYKGQLESYKDLDPYYYQVYVLNEWGSAKGAAFPEFRNAPDKGHRWTHVVKAFEIPEGWRFSRSYDFGYSKPFSCGWWAQDFDGMIYRVAELYGCGKEPNVGTRKDPAEQARMILETERQHPLLAGRKIYGVADPAIWDKSRGESIADTMERHGIYFDKGDHARIAGRMQVHYRLAFDANGKPMMQVFDTCKDTIRTMPELLEDEHNPEDVDSDGEDHCLVGETVVVTSEGKKTMSDMAGTLGLVYGHDGALHAYSDCRMTQPDAEIIEIELEDGTVIKATPNHKFMLEDGTWTRAYELTEGVVLFSMDHY